MLRLGLVDSYPGWLQLPKDKILIHVADPECLSRIQIISIPDLSTAKRRGGEICHLTFLAISVTKLRIILLLEQVQIKNEPKNKSIFYPKNCY